VQVTYLTIADFSMREELVLKIAILAGTGANVWMSNSS
jgi:hypothetical protein